MQRVAGISSPASSLACSSHRHEKSRAEAANQKASTSCLANTCGKTELAQPMSSMHFVHGGAMTA